MLQTASIKQLTKTTEEKSILLEYHTVSIGKKVPNLGDVCCHR